MYSYIHVDFLRVPVFSQQTERQIRQLLPFVPIAVLDTSLFLEADSMSFVVGYGCTYSLIQRSTDYIGIGSDGTKLVVIVCAIVPLLPIQSVLHLF